MKYKIPQDKLDKIVFKYLDSKLKDLEKYSAVHYEGIVYRLPNDEYGILGFRNSGKLLIYYKLIDEISDMFSMDEIDSEKLVGRWAEDRLQIEVKDTRCRYIPDFSFAVQVTS